SPLASLGENAAMSGNCLVPPRSARGEQGNGDGCPFGAPLIAAIGYDACLMGMIEVAYEPKRSSEVMVASEETEPCDGWPYEQIMRALVSNPTMDAALLGSITVREYINSYPLESAVTLSAVHTTSSLDNLASATTAFANAMMASGEWTQIKQARASTENFYYSSGADLYDFAKEVYIRISSQAVKDAAIALGNAINNNVIAEAHKSGHPEVHGIAIYFPSSYGPSPTYYSTNFAINTSWDEFLDEYATH
ncbi:MAG: clostripain-related cysteine peptidase, partial [bacterium]